MALLTPGSGRADGSDLYSSEVIVTGRDNLPERVRGIREALPKVLVKVSGDADVAARAEAAGLLADGEKLVVGLDYVDRKEGIQISDEQGTRERSFRLTVHFDPARIDDLLAKLGAAAWTGERPGIGLVLVIDDGRSTYLLTRTSKSGYGQRLVVDDVARALALPVDLPETADGTDAEAALAALPAGQMRLAGRMVATPDGYWNAVWHLGGTVAGTPVTAEFSFTHATFDTAIGDALKATARRLAVPGK